MQRHVPRLIVAEAFGPTFQGEGPSTGQRCGFVRLSRCNLDCSWCDTPFTWDWKGKNGVAYNPVDEARKATVEEVVDVIRAWGVPLLVLTGGEPLLQRTAVEQLVDVVRSIGMGVEIETNGTQSPLWMPDPGIHYNVSPKLSSSGVNLERAWRPQQIAELLATGTAVFKFVVCSRADLLEVAGFVDDYQVPPELVWIMPEGRTPDAIVDGHRELADEVLAAGWQMSTRLHVLAWGDERGH